MTLPLLFGSFAATAVGVLVHVVWWRIRRPADDALALGFATGAIPFFLSGILFFFLPPDARPIPGTLDFWTCLAGLAFLHGLLAFVYTSAYTAVQAASPTVLIVLQAHEQPKGATRAELAQRLTDDLVCGNLINAAIDEKFIDSPSGRLQLGRRGRKLLRIGRVLRRLAGLPPPVG